MRKANGISRRDLLKNAGAVAAAGALGASGALAASQPASSQSGRSGGPRALALIGDRFHNPDYIRVSLDKVFKDLSIPIDYTIQYDQISQSLLKNYQLLLILRDGMIWPDGYLGPDAYTDYEANLETPKTFPNPSSPYRGLRRTRVRRLKTSSARGMVFTRFTIAAIYRPALKTIVR